MLPAASSISEIEEAAGSTLKRARSKKGHLGQSTHSPNAHFEHIKHKFSSLFAGIGYPGTGLDAPEVDVYQDLLISHFMFASILLPNTYPYIEGSRVSVMEAHLNATGSC